MRGVLVEPEIVERRADLEFGADLNMIMNERAAAAAVPNPFNAYIRIAPDNTVTVLSKHIEMGQGSYSGLARIVAEELDADWAQMRADGAPANTKLYANLAFGKPYLLAEFGIDWQAGDEKWDPKGNGLNMHNGAWAALASGSAGTAMLWWWDGYVHPKNVYHVLTPVKAFADAIDWANTPFRPIEEVEVLGDPSRPETFSDVTLDILERIAARDDVAGAARRPGPKSGCPPAPRGLCWPGPPAPRPSNWQARPQTCECGGGGGGVNGIQAGGEWAWGRGKRASRRRVPEAIRQEDFMTCRMAQITAAAGTEQGPKVCMRGDMQPFTCRPIWTTRTHMRPRRSAATTRALALPLPRLPTPPHSDAHSGASQASSDPSTSARRCCRGAGRSRARRTRPRA